MVSTIIVHFFSRRNTKQVKMKPTKGHDLHDASRVTEIRVYGDGVRDRFEDHETH